MNNDEISVKAMRNLEKRLANTLIRTFGTLQKDIIRKLRSRVKASLWISLFSTAELARLLNDAVGDDLDAIQQAALIDALRNIGETGAASTYNEWIANFRDNKLTEVWSEIAETTELEIRSAIRKIVTENPNLSGAALLDKLNQRMDNYFNKRIPQRMRAVAQTTTTQTFGATAKESHRRNGFVSVWRHTGRAKRDRKTHMQADGQKANEKGLFTVGGESVRYPGDGSASNAINCHCVLRAQRE